MYDLKISGYNWTLLALIWEYRIGYMVRLLDAILEWSQETLSNYSVALN